jgi:tetratricopeptide (TPR) repeat protein
MRATLARPALALLLLVPLLRADDAAGLQLARQARQKLLAGEAEAALELLDKARIELPGSEVVACTRGDALSALGRVDEALAEYERASSSPLAFHAAFNGATALSKSGESELEAADVPADVGALPEGPQPAMLEALGKARGKLEGAQHQFLEALDLRDDADARESLGALNRRLDALAAIEEELRKREDPHQKDEQQPPKDPQDQQKQQQDPQKQDQPPQDQPPPEGEPKDKPPEDQPPEDKPEDKPPEQPQNGEPPEPKPGEPDPQQPQDQQQPSEPPKPAGELSEQEVQQLLDRLSQLEDAARERQKLRELRAHRKAERDW